jgi:hypothetical protein
VPKAEVIQHITKVRSWPEVAVAEIFANVCFQENLHDFSYRILGFL